MRSAPIIRNGGFKPEPTEIPPPVIPSCPSHYGEDTDSRQSLGSRSQEPDEESPLLYRPPTPSTVWSVAATTATASPFLKKISASQFYSIFSQLLLSHFIACFDGTIMATSHPVITSYFHASNSASWLSTAFLLTSSAFQPLLGRLSDHVGRKPIFVGALVVFTVAVIWCSLAQTIESFILARAVCGLGAGGIMTMGSIITSDLVPIEIRGKNQAYFNANYGIGSALGAATGGALAESLGWRWEFGIQVPPLLLCIFISIVAIPNDLGLHSERQSAWKAMASFDVKGSILLSSSVGFLIIGLSLGGNVLQWSHPLSIASLVLFTILFPLFLVAEFHADKPIMPLYLIHHPPHANILFTNFLSAFLGNSIIFNIPLYFQAVLLKTATSSGLFLVIPSIAASMMGTFVGFAVMWTYRLKWPIQTGTICLLLGTIGLANLRHDLPEYIHLIILLSSSIGQGFLFAGSSLALLAVSKQTEQAVVSSTINLWRSLGQVIGVASSSLILQTSLIYYLNQLVHGDRRDEVISRVRKSVEEVARLDPYYRQQVILSYEGALRLTFTSCIILAFISVCIIIPIHLPRLSSVKQ